MKQFVDDIAAYVVEQELMCGLRTIFSPVSVEDIENQEIRSIAGESDESRAYREELGQKYEVLSQCLQICKRYIVGRTPGMEDKK